jgi:hypothetical protein
MTVMPTTRPPANITSSTRDIMQLVAELCPGCGMSMANVPVEDEAAYNEVLVWNEDNPLPKPTWTEVVAQAAVVKQYLIDAQYQIDRIGPDGYASLGEQADMQYRDAIHGTTEWIDHIAAVKARFPK